MTHVQLYVYCEGQLMMVSVSFPADVELSGVPRHYPILCCLGHRAAKSLHVDTSTGRKFALVEGLSHDLESVPDRFIMSLLHGRCGTVNYHPF